MNIDAGMVKQLREQTGLGMMDCKKALVEAEGNMEKAVEILRKKGLAKAQRKQSREASEGVITSYIHLGGKIGVMMEVNCETDFVAKNEQFQTLAKELCMQVAASNPLYISREDVPEKDIEKERDILMAQADMQKKPENVREKITEGRLNKFYEEICLLEQPYIRDPNKKIETLIQEKIAGIGENIQVRRFVRYLLGEKE